MKCKVCRQQIQLLISGTVPTHKDGKVICPASGVGPGHRDHPDALMAPNVTWEELGRGYIDWPKPDETKTYLHS